MADAANTPEKETEISATLGQGAVSVEGMVSLPASVPAVNPKSPVEVKEDQVDDEVDLTVQEPPEKRARKSLEDELGKLMERTREGYDLTAAALEKVQQHLDISRQLGKDLTQLAQEVHCDKVGAKYQLAQLQQVLSSFQNLEWQVGGLKTTKDKGKAVVTNTATTVVVQGTMPETVGVQSDLHKLDLPHRLHQLSLQVIGATLQVFPNRVVRVSSNLRCPSSLSHHPSQRSSKLHALVKFLMKCQIHNTRFCLI